MPSKELCTIQSRVEEVLKVVPETRSDDMLLMQIYYSAYHNIHFIRQLREKGIPSPETIRRSRQKIQHDGRYRADEKVADARAELEVEYADHFGN